jgi:hypothetical protein
LGVLPASARGQTSARVGTQENFRRAPNGELLGRLEAGTPLSVVSRGDGWLEVAVEGWVWERSLQMDSRDGFDLVVSEAGGENLRSAPSGTLLGRLEAGTLLEEVERERGWIHVRRQGWIWEPSVAVDEPPPPEVETVPGPTPPREAQAPAAARRAGGYVTAGAQGAPILTAPDGDTLATATAASELEVLAREGSWVRVRVEGWAWMPEVDSAAVEGAGDVLVPGDLTADPLEHRGRVVVWNLQFISLEEAERVRTDFFEGEPFLLCRFGDAGGEFVYVAVPPERIEELEGLVPLENITVTGRVRTGASALTGTPIVDLLALERVRRPR